MADGDKGGSSGAAAQAAAANTDVKIEIDGKSFGVEDVKNLLAQQASVTQKSQELASVSKILEKYGTDAETYLGQSEAALHVIGQLMEQGMIDEQGNLKQAEVKQEIKPNPLEFLKRQGGESGDEKTAKIVEAALGKVTSVIDQRLRAIEQDQSAILRDQITTRVQAKYPSFTNDAVSELLVRASKDNRKSLWEHAEVFSTELGTRQETAEKDFAKKYGIDLDEARNKLKEQSAEGGVMASFQGKKFSFGKGPGGAKDKVSPLDATIEFLKKSGR